MLKKVLFYIKVAYKLFTKDVISNEDYKIEYNKVSSTYDNWINKMGEFTEKIIKPEYISKDNKIKILDLACGTGYISKSLLSRDIDCEITAVDISDKMIEQLKTLGDNRLKVINCDGLEYLKNTEEKYDAIFFGWALSYFNYRDLFKLFKRVLNQGGIVGIISNVQGTLSGIEGIFMKVMCENPEEVIKPMDIRFNLPKGKEGLRKWFAKYGFEEIEVEDGELIVNFNTPDQLLKWLNETGATAGTSCIFKNYDVIQNNLIEEISKSKYKDGKYEINHKFTYGLFRLK